MEKLIITAAICGAEVTKEQNPAVPYTVEEIVREAKSAVDAGAAIVHLHVREDDVCSRPNFSRKWLPWIVAPVISEMRYLKIPCL